MLRSVDTVSSARDFHLCSFVLGGWLREISQQGRYTGCPELCRTHMPHNVRNFFVALIASSRSQSTLMELQICAQLRQKLARKWCSSPQTTCLTDHVTASFQTHLLACLCFCTPRPLASDIMFPDSEMSMFCLCQFFVIDCRKTSRRLHTKPSQPIWKAQNGRRTNRFGRK